MQYKVSQKAIDKFKKVDDYVLKLQLAIGCNTATAKKYLDENSIMLTTRAAYMMMQKETGMRDKDFWENNKPTPIRKLKTK